MKRRGNPGAGGFPGGSGDLGVYVHFPFCRSRCSYCDFPTEARRRLPHARYASAVLAELARRAPAFQGRRLRSVYFGGGTPGLWRPDLVAAVTTAIRAAFAEARDPEITLEMNPGDRRPRLLTDLRAAGINRLSLGVQSLDDAELRLLGRRASRAEAVRAMAAARAAGFDNLSCDLIFALPGQTLAGFQRTLEEMVDLGPEHLSVYALTVEDKTPLAARVRAGSLELPDEDQEAAMFEAADAWLRDAGYEHYEISNFSLPGRQAVHNSLYWLGVEYLGLGAAAHSLWVDSGGTAERQANPRDPDAYMTAAHAGTLGPETVERLDLPARRREALWLGLRRLEGILREDYRACYGVDPVAVAAAPVTELVGLGLLEVTSERLMLTRRGLLLADEVAVRLL